MDVLITGGTGFIGAALCDSLAGDGHDLTVLSRGQHQDSPGRRFVANLDSLAGSHFDAVVNLAGASLAQRRWSAAYKREILDSRLTTTASLVALLARLDTPPAVLVSASAVGFYGHHGDERLAEDGDSVPGFAQELCQRWEASAMAASDLGVRVCVARLGVVLGRGDGALEQMARPFRFGVANWLGDGRQWLSWVHLADTVAALRYLLERDSLSGPFNITAPEPVTSRGFCDAMKRHRRTLVTAPVPAAAMRLMVGEMADELLLRGQRVVPAALLEAGFQFRYPAIDDALAELL